MPHTINTPMTEVELGGGPVSDPDKISLLAAASVLVRWRKTIVASSLIGGLIGGTIGLTTTRVYTSTAVFIPHGSESGTSGLSAAAGQLGLRLPPAGGGWSPAMYVELLRSRALLEPIVLDVVQLPEQGGRRVVLMDLLQVEDSTRERRVDRAVRRVSRFVFSREKRALGAVELVVTTQWPTVSFAIAEDLLSGVNRFNYETRKSQAAAERQFVDVQASEAERALIVAEDKLKVFLERNRVISGSPELVFERDRLQREVTLRQELYTALLQRREEARIREVRDTPVITVLEQPRIALRPERRQSLLKSILGGLAGGMIGVLIAFLAEAITRAQRRPSEDAREFFQLVRNATPSALRRFWP